MTDLIPLFRSSDKHKGITFEHCVERRFINAELGYGLVAKEFIPPGSVIFAENVALTTEVEHLECGSMKEVNKLLAGKVKAMGPEWFRKFLELPNSNKEELGIFAGIWDSHQMPIVINEKRSGVLGLNLASVNHACIPNCSLNLVSCYPKDKDGKELKDERPTVERVIVRATQCILENEEVTIPYWYAKGQHKARELFSWTEFNFFCSCQSCAQPIPELEDALDTYNKAEKYLRHPETVEKWPAMAFRSAQDVITKLLCAQVRDARIPMIWAKCGLIASFHLDIARALCFLSKAYKMLEILEGTEGVFYKQILRWCAIPSLMPGFGVTTRGLSTVKEGEEIFNDCRSQEILFMSAAKPDEYIRVSRYRRLPETIAIVRGSRYLVIPEEHIKLKIVHKAGSSNQGQSSNNGYEQDLEAKKVVMVKRGGVLCPEEFPDQL
ncbi:hypothetical protein BBP40_008996 [Aspergillus hancockii]|nr:hypothetical protein BBP40_008996 [Aspergillus hancockii]